MKPNFITSQAGLLFAGDFPTIPMIPGEGVGLDIMPSALEVFEKAVRKVFKGSKQIKWFEVLAGNAATTRGLPPLPEETLQILKTHFVAIKGPLGTPVGKGHRSLNVALRQELDLYSCTRPVRYFPGVYSPVKHPHLVDMVIFRENTEDVYAGVEFASGSDEVEALLTKFENNIKPGAIRFPDTAAIGLKPISQEGSERLIRSAIDYAITHKRPSVTIVHKGNIMKLTEGAFLQWGYALAERDFGDQVFTWAQYDRIKDESGPMAANTALKNAKEKGLVVIQDCIADNFLQKILLRPSDYSVIATTNLNGDYISDALAAQVGGIGIAPGGNINYQTGHAIFEATHGTAPKYAGQNKANPCSVLLSGAMMFEHIGWSEVSNLIQNCIQETFSAKIGTFDIARLQNGEGRLRPDWEEVSCSRFCQLVMANM